MERQRDMGRLKGKLTTAFKHLVGGYREDGATLLSKSHHGGKGDRRDKLRHWKFPLDLRIPFLLVCFLP